MLVAGDGGFAPPSLATTGGAPATGDGARPSLGFLPADADAAVRASWRHLVRRPPGDHPRPAALVVVGALFVACWLPALLTRGWSEDLGDLMYLPVLAAAWFWGCRGGLVAGLAAWVILAPAFTPHLYHREAKWITAGVIYCIFGLAGGMVSNLLARRYITVRQMADELASTYANTLVLIARSLELRDVDTAGHSERVAVNARAVAGILGLRENVCDLLYWAGLLHDVGKIAVPEAILHKPGALDPDEVVRMRRHVEVGVSLLRLTSSAFNDVARAVEAHHERWDGSGYPAGLRGDDIPLEGRILAAVDVYDALTSPRPYRCGMTSAEALSYLRGKRGVEFDPIVVDAFLRLAEDAENARAPRKSRACGERDVALPRPGSTSVVRADGLWAELLPETPGEHWTVGVEAFGVRLDDPLDAERGERGERLPVGLDLEWEAGSPPFGAVRGELLLGDERVAFDGTGALEQRPVGADEWTNPWCRLTWQRDEQTGGTARDRAVELDRDPAGLPIAARADGLTFDVAATAVVPVGTRLVLGLVTAPDAHGWLESCPGSAETARTSRP